MPRLFLAAALGVLLLAQQAMAQAATPIDPAWLPADLRAKRFTDCGLVMGVDRRWSLASERSVSSAGRPKTVYDISLGQSFWRSDPRAGDDVLLSPHLQIKLSCAEARMLADPALRELAETARSRAGRFASAVNSFQRRGLGTLYFFTAPSKQSTGLNRGLISDTAFVYGQSKGRSLFLYLTIGREPPSSFNRPMRAGQELNYVNRAGRPARLRLERAARQHPSSRDIGFLRTARENDSLIRTILGSLRAI